MTTLPTRKDFYHIICNDISLIDVRAPVEYCAGSFPMAENFPILDDEDRHQVGICYKQRGKEAAFALAYKRVSGAVKEERVKHWVDFIKKNPDALFYCFRGGMRSKTAQEWYHEATGKVVPRLEGGYKALRRFLIDAMDPENIPALPVTLAGRTGTGKTELLKKLINAVDLEGLANHRGSTFGSFLSPQPTQIDFENRLASALIKHKEKKFQYLILEDEGSYIGSRYIPQDLADYFRRDSMILLESSLEERIATIHKEYVVFSQQEYIELYGKQDGLAKWLENKQGRVTRIRKRLGGLRYKKVVQLMEESHEKQLQTGSPDTHKLWIELLIRDYYDPMYDYQIEKSGRKTDFKGGFAEVLEYLQNLESVGD